MDFDVAVIGASSAGLFAAEQLAHAGKTVAVYEQRVTPFVAPRTLIVTPHFLRFISNFPSEIYLHRTSIFQVASTNECFRIQLQTPDLIVDRAALISSLRAKAALAGARIYDGYRFQQLLPGARGAQISLRKLDQETICITARAVIGADGVFSDVGRVVGISPAPTVPILQAQVLLPSSWDSDVTQVWFDTDDTRFFYWLIPESTEQGVVGLVGDGTTNNKRALDRFLSRHGFKPRAYQGGVIAMHHPSLRPWTRIGSTPVLLIGDAAGQVKVTTVGGTVSGFMGAQAAVQSLLKGTPYSHALLPLKRELDLHWLIRAILERLDNAGYNRLFHSITPRIQRFLSLYHRDEMAGAIWKLAYLEPLLALRVASLLLYPSRNPVTHATAPATSVE